MRRDISVCALLLGSAITASILKAEVTLDLATSSPQADGTTALFYRTDLQPTGTGVIQPFVRIQNKPTEEGYNTDGPIEFDTKDHTGQNWTHSITLSQVPIVNIGGINYREFLLDINESTAQNNRFLSMNEFEVYLSNTNVLTSFNRTTHTFASPANSTALVYDMDASGDKLVRMDYSQASGSGSGDMFVYVKDSLFTGSGPYVYLYSKFGTPDASDAGFEEWATRPGPTNPPTVPLPASIWGGLTLLALMGAAKLRSRRLSA